MAEAMGVLRRYMEERVYADGDISVPALADAALAELPEDVLDELRAQSLRQVFTACARAVVKGTRSQRARSRRPDPMAAFIAKRATKRAAEGILARWMTFREDCGPGQSIRLMDMTRSQLEIAEARRRGRARVEEAYADLWAILRARLGEGERVGDRWTPQQIEQEWRQTSGERGVV